MGGLQHHPETCASHRPRLASRAGCSGEEEAGVIGNRHPPVTVTILGLYLRFPLLCPKTSLLPEILRCGTRSVLRCILAWERGESLMRSAVGGKWRQ